VDHSRQYESDCSEHGFCKVIPLNRFILKQNNNSVNAAGFNQLKNIIMSLEAHTHMYQIKVILSA
jgi:hypothetical protein